MFIRDKKNYLFNNNSIINKNKSINTFIQRKLLIGLPYDKYEQEAGRVADKVVNKTDITGIQKKCTECSEEENLQKKPLASEITPIVQMQKDEEEQVQTKPWLQMKLDSNGEKENYDSLESQLNKTKGTGNNLPDNTKSFMKSRFGTDFSDVKIHTDGAAIQMNKEVNAQAFTHGKDVYFNSGKYDPESGSGKHLLAHELTHVIQQGAGIQRAALIQKNPGPKKKPKKQSKLTAADVMTFIKANNKSSVSTELLLCLIWKESTFNPNDKSSTSTATGLMQVTTGAVKQVNKSSPKGIHFKHSEMTDSAKNIDCGTRYLQIRIDWAKGDVKAGLEGYGTGSGYADDILACETCITSAPQNTDSCLRAIHP
jgi:hypothetical protein